MTPAQPVRAGTADQLARLAAHRGLDHADGEQLDAVAHWILGDVGGAHPASVLWADLRGPCLDLYALIADDWDDDNLDALTDEQYATLPDHPTPQWVTNRRWEVTYRRLTEYIERQLWVARYQARAEARTAAYRAHRADVEARVHPKAAS